MSVYSKDFVEQVQDILNIGIALSGEKNHKKLLERILSEARRITQCDAGTLYIVENQHLAFKIIQNDTLKIYQGGMGESIDLPPVDITSTTVSGYCALHKEVVNIRDVYKSKYKEIDFSGPRHYDAITGYKTLSMLVVPLENHDGVIIGVLQLINAKNEQGEVTPFPEYLEKVVQSLGSQAAVSISNMNYLEELDGMLHAFVRVISTAIDERSPYNANHTRNVARLSGMFARYLQEQSHVNAYSLSNEDIEQLEMSAWLHDIGKIAVSLEVMDKSTRLGDRYELVKNRMRAIGEQRKVQAIKLALQNDEQLKTDASIDAFWVVLAEIEKEMNYINELLEKINDPSCFVDDTLQMEIIKLSKRTWLTKDMVEEPWILPEEVEALSILRGTLTVKERRIMENHVMMTKKMLDKIPFGSKYSAVAEWASSHHEFLDGTGYPEKLKADALPLEVRILTIMDIYDALTAVDRPYRKGLSIKKAFLILEDMAMQGKIDADLIRIFKESKVWDSGVGTLTS